MPAHRPLALLLAAALALTLAACSDEAPAPTATATPTAAITPAPTPTPPTSTPSPTATPTTEPTATPAPSPASTPSPTPTPTPTAAPTPTSTPSPTPTAAPTPTSTPTPQPAESATTFRYDTYDTTGEVAEPGSYAFLADSADASSAVTTYEGLRDGTARALRIHETDAEGVSRAAFLDSIEVGDLFEWRQAEDCWVRYRVGGIATGSGVVREFAVRSYSHTYTGCSGAIGGSAARQFTWSPEVLKTGAFTAPTWHGPWLLVPKSWTGPVPEMEPLTGPFIPWPPSPLPTFELGAGWTGGIGPGYPPWELEGAYSHTDGGSLFVYISQLGRWPIATYRLSTTYAAAGVIHEFRMIDGRHAVVSYDRIKTVTSQATVVFYDEATGLVYTVRGGPKSRKNDPEATIEIARKFVLPPADPPQTAFRYDTYDTTGEVAEPGSYAFLADPAAASSAVTTYEALRDGTATALRIHATDADGVSRAAFLDTVEAGDLFEWRQAEDCFVRYTVTDLLPEPSGTPRRLLGVEWMTYAFTGCNGPIAPDAAATVDWGELPDLGGTSLSVPVVHGAFQLVPEGWAGAVRPGEVHELPSGASYPSAGLDTDSLRVARGLPYWRDPALPTSWTFSTARGGGYDVSYGYCAAYASEEGHLAVRVCGEHAWDVRWAEEASWLARGGSGELLQGAAETRTVAGRAALASYSPPGPNHSDSFTVTLRVYDAATQSVYTVIGFDPSLLGSNVEGAIAIARSLFEPPNPP